MIGIGMIMKSKRTTTFDISPQAKASVRSRDKECIFCGRTGHDIMHYIPRLSGGLGIVQNLALGCRQCHMNLDQTTKREVMLKHFKEHLDKHYPNFEDNQRVFKKWSRSYD